MDSSIWEGESVIECKYCEVEKPESEMSTWAGKPSKVCVECKKDHPVGAGARRANGNGGGANRKKSSAAARTPKRAAADLELALPAGGFGVNAKITEEGYLQLTQENDGAATDNVCLTRFEAKQIFDTFGTWIVEQ